MKMMRAFFKPPRRSKDLFLAMPASVLSTEPSLLLKTLKVGYIARAAGIFRITKFIIYKDNYTRKKDYILFKKLMKYIITPPYLRKRVVPLDPDLRYAGILPPLQVPSHLAPAEPISGSYVDAYIYECGSSVCYAYAGPRMNRIKVINVNKKYYNKIITIKIIKKNNELISVPEEPKFYWNYYLEAKISIKYIIKKYKRKYLLIATSRVGEKNIEDKIKNIIKKYKGAIVFIGGPTGHLWEAGGVSREEFDFIYNAVEEQGCRTIRSEEATFIVLSKLDSVF